MNNLICLHDILTDFDLRSENYNYNHLEILNFKNGFDNYDAITYNRNLGFKLQYELQKFISNIKNETSGSLRIFTTDGKLFFYKFDCTDDTITINTIYEEESLFYENCSFDLDQEFIDRLEEILKIIKYN